jgi:hypothetical protein
MSTTLTIDDDVADELHRLRRARDIGLKEFDNDELRPGLRDMTSEPKPRKPLRTRSFDPGRVLIDNVDNIGEVLALIEGEASR